MLQNYIFDFGNVLTVFDPDLLTAPHIEDAKTRKIVSEVVFDRLYWDALDWGTITDEEIKADIRRRLPAHLRDIGCATYDRWVHNLTPVAGMEKLVADLKKTGAKLYILSNISIGFANTYKEVPWIRKLFSLFDGIILSGTVGIAKPGKEIFAYMLKTFEIKAEESLFIDDNAKNIETAKSLGISGYLFDGDSERLRDKLGI